MTRMAKLVVTVSVLVLALAGCSSNEEKKPRDGSEAGANAVTAKEIVAETSRDTWESGEWSVTLDDLNRKYEFGEAYPANGKEAALQANTTHGRGAGMVDMITYDVTTNVEIRHYGQMQEDGTVRWYAAETVLDENGKPVVMPRN